MASCWEMAIKASLGKLRLARPVERFVSEQMAANGFTLLNIELRHTAKVEKLPFHHRIRLFVC
jgi:PIN domain nuclease of toxin-antitoxin system